MLRGQLSQRLAGLFDAAVNAIESLIERIGDPNGPASDKRALALSHERISELAREVEFLEGHNESLERELEHMQAAIEVISKMDEHKADVRTDGACTCGEQFRTAEDYRDHLPCIPSSRVLLTKEEQDALRFSLGLMDQDHVAAYSRRHSQAIRAILNRTSDRG